MKKLVLLFVCMFAVSTMTMADNDKPIPVTQLPAKAQTFLQTYFKDSKVALSKQESDLFYKSYDVVFTNGEEVEFDKSGEWTEVNCRINGVPNSIIPEAIKNYVSTNYPDTQVMHIERESRGGYEIKLSNRLEITFNKNLQVIDIDD